MTTIATDGKTIAADGLSVNGLERMTKRERKIRVEHGRIYAMAGAIAMFRPLINWHASGADPSAVPKATGSDVRWTMIVIERDKPLTFFTEIIQYPDVVLETKFFAIGTGQDYALGAMHAGKCPREAVEIASNIDNNSGGEILVVDIQEALDAALVQAAE